MMVSATWFLWLELYASTRRWLNWSVAERTHIVSWAPSSGLPLVLVLLSPLPHAATVSAKATPTTGNRHLLMAMSAPHVEDLKLLDADRASGGGRDEHAHLPGHDRREGDVVVVGGRRRRGRLLTRDVDPGRSVEVLHGVGGRFAIGAAAGAERLVAVEVEPHGVEPGRPAEV